MAIPLMRRSLVRAAVAGSAAIIVRPGRAADYRFKQYHNQAAIGTLHKNLLAMWEAIKTESNGRVEAEVFAENSKVAGGDPEALKMLIAGEIQFFTLMGGVIGPVVPVAEVQQVPFAFATASVAHRAIDGPLGAYIGQEMAANGMHLFPVAGFDNGMRHVAAISRAVASPEDLAGMKIRVPPGQMIFDTFKALGAEPITTTSDAIYSALQSGMVDAQENPLAIIDGFGLYELVKYVGLTNHIWSGFNLMSHLPTWQRLPDDIKTVIERNAAQYVRRQRIEQGERNTALRADLTARGLVFNEVDPAPFRARLDGLYATWRDKLGAKCWGLLEASRGQLG